MAKNGVIFSEADFIRAGNAIRRVEQDPVFRGKPIPVRQRNPPSSPAPVCAAQNAVIQFTVFGSPTGGSFDASLWSINGTSGTPTFDYDFTAAEVKTEMVATYSNISTDEITATGGPFPDATISLEFTDELASTNIVLPNLDYSSLTGGSGVAVLPSFAQLGIAAS